MILKVAIGYVHDLSSRNPIFSSRNHAISAFPKLICSVFFQQSTAAWCPFTSCSPSDPFLRKLNQVSLFSVLWYLIRVPDLSKQPVHHLVGALLILMSTLIASCDTSPGPAAFTFFRCLIVSLESALLGCFGRINVGRLVWWSLFRSFLKTSAHLLNWYSCTVRVSTLLSLTGLAAII